MQGAAEETKIEVPGPHLIQALAKLLADERANRAAGLDALHQALLGTLIALLEPDEELRYHGITGALLFLKGNALATVQESSSTASLGRLLERAIMEDGHAERR